MRHLLFIPGLLFLSVVSAQRVIDVGKDNVNIANTYYAVGGWAVSVSKYVKLVEGSPYFNPNWMKARLLMKDSTEYINILVRLDLVSNNLEYIGQGKQEMITSAASIREIILIDSVTGKSSRLIHSSAVTDAKELKGWLQVLVSGKATLYKYILKEVNEDKPYGSATTEQKIATSNRYYIYAGDSFVRIKKPADIPVVLADKKKELSAIIGKNNPSGKTDDDFIGLVHHYNQLAGQ